MIPSPHNSTKTLRLLAGVILLCSGFWMQAQLPAVSFNHLKRDIDIYSSRFRALTEDNRGFIWFGSSDGGGLYRYDGYTLRSFTFDPSRLKTSLSNSRINAICPINDTLMYIGTSFGYSTLNPITGAFRSYNNVLEELEDGWMAYIYDFIYDSLHQTLWVATAYGLAAINHHDGVFRMKEMKSADTGTLRHYDVRALHPDIKNPNRIYFINQEGLFTYDINSGQTTEMSNPWGSTEKWYAIEMCQTADGRLFVAPHINEVLEFFPETNTWKSYPLPVSKKYPDQKLAVLKIVPQGSDKLLVSTFTQVGFLDLRTGSFEGWEYDPENAGGLLPNHYYVDLMADRHGKLWVSSWQGVQYTHQAILHPSGNVNDLQVAVTAIEVTPKFEKDSSLLLYTAAQYMDKTQRDLTIHYVLPNPMEPANVRYQFMLEGYDQDWISTDQRTARYSRLKGGDYVFKVRAREGKQAEWTETTILPVHIPKRLTETIWFWSVTGIAFLALGFGLFYFLISRARKEARIKAEFEHQLSEIQMQALRAQMNPHFLFNSLNSIKYFAISKSKDETAAYLSKFAMLVRAILNNSKEKTISLNDELEALRLYIEIEHLRLEGKFDYEINIDNNIRTKQVQIPPMILQPYVENAIWHGLMHKDGKGLLRVEVKDMGRQIQCVIEDNGIGRVKSAEMRKAQVDHRKSVGMQITGDRIALINRMYHIDTRVDVIDLYKPDGMAAGTRVVIHIPLIHDEEE